MAELSAVDLGPRLEQARSEHGLPALAAAVVRDGELIAAGAVGERIAGSGVPVTVHDQWHLGSNTKSITATVAASLVEEGVITWETTVAEIFEGSHVSWAEVSLADLLHHRGGVPELGTYHLFAWRFGEQHPRQIRADWAASVASGPTEADRGRFRYANAGYVLAGAMLEAVADAPWQDLVRERVFEPLGMERAGFGPPQLPYNPSGHATLPGADRMPTGDSPWADNPVAMGPAGTVHAPLADWGRYAGAHLAVLSDTPGPLDGDSYAWLHRPPVVADGEADYAAGWIALRDLEWTSGPAVFHNGANGSWYALMVLIPGRDMAVLCASNTFDEGAVEPGCFEVVEQLATDAAFAPPSAEPEEPATDPAP